jgi:hypothetical protein
VKTPELERHFAYLEAEWAAAQAAPLSRRRAMLVVMLVDAFVDRLFAADASSDDILEFRSRLGRQVPALGLVMQLAADKPDGPRLVTEAVEIALEDYPRLDLADYMVSLYNDRTVQRVCVALPDGARRLAHDVLGEVVEALRQL